MRRLLFQMHALSSHCAVLPLVAAVFLLGAARIEGTVPGRTPGGPRRSGRWCSPTRTWRSSTRCSPSGPRSSVSSSGSQVSRAIAEEARRAGYDPLLILAIIDVESDFDVDAVSSRGARGLMQIQPVTLHWFAEKQGLRLTREEMAADPALCVRLGIRYLRSLQDRFGGDLSMALMAYNAGPDRIRQAIRERSSGPVPVLPAPGEARLRALPHRRGPRR